MYQNWAMVKAIKDYHLLSDCFFAAKVKIIQNRIIAQQLLSIEIEKNSQLFNQITKVASAYQTMQHLLLSCKNTIHIGVFLKCWIVQCEKNNFLFYSMENIFSSWLKQLTGTKLYFVLDHITSILTKKIMTRVEHWVPLAHLDEYINSCWNFFSCFLILLVWIIYLSMLLT